MMKKPRGKSKRNRVLNDQKVRWGANDFRDEAAKSMSGILAEADFLVKAVTQQFIRGAMHQPLLHEKILEVKSAVQQALDEYVWAISCSDDKCHVACLGLRDRLGRMRRGQHADDDEE